MNKDINYADNMRHFKKWARDIDYELMYGKKKDMNKTEVYKVLSDTMIDKLQTNGFKIDQKELQEEIPKYIWVLEVENTKGIVYLFGNINNFKDVEDFANQARSFALDLVNKSR